MNFRLVPLFLSFCICGFAQLPKDFYDQKFISGFDFPMGITFDEEGKGYVWEKKGKVWIIDQEGQLQAEPLIDISEQVANWKDHGLTGFVLDPNFSNNGYYYLLYAVDLHYYKFFGTPQYHSDSTTIETAFFGRVVRYTADPSTGFSTTIKDSEHILLGESIENGIPLLYAFHGLGSLIMGTDGTLLLSIGDATSNRGIDIGGDSLGTFVSPALAEGIITPDQDIGSYKSQYVGSYSGKILRIDAKTGNGLKSNPFFDPQNPRSPQSRVWALGFRNPYRIVLKPDSGSHFPGEGNPGVIYVGDVGNGAWEEVNIVTKGGQNFGWPIMEGYNLNWGFWIIESPSNPLAPNPLFGVGDCTEEFITFRNLFQRLNRDESPITQNPCNSAVPIPDGPYTIQEAAPAVSWSNARWNLPTRAQVATFTEEHGNLEGIDIGNPESGVIGENFDGFSSLAGIFYQGDNFPESYRRKYFGVDFSGWIKVFEFNEEEKLVSVEAFHNDSKNIIHLSENPVDGQLYYINLEGEVRKISYGGNPPPVAIINADKNFGRSPLTVKFDASASYDNLPIVEYAWEFSDGTIAQGITTEHTFNSPNNEPGAFKAILTVTDSLGEKGVAEMVISPNNSPPNVSINSFKDGDQYPTNATTLLILDADVSDAEHSNEELFYEWKVYLHHNDHFHPEPSDFAPKSHTLISPLGCSGELYWFRIELTVTDPAGLSTKDSRQVFPYCGDPFIDWTVLEAKAFPDKNQLRWETNLEKDIQSFEIQRGNDFFNFTKIGELVAGQSNYFFEDLDPLKGTNIYRVKVLKNDGAYLFSNMVSVSYPPVSDIRVFPNPARTSFNVDIKEVQAGIIELELYNVAGSYLSKTTWEAIPGQAFQKIVPTKNLASGVYFYRIINGASEKTERIVINK